MKLSEMRNYTKIKHSVSFPPLHPHPHPPHPKVWGDFYLKNALNGEKNVFGQIYGGMFYMRTNDQIMQEGRKSFINALSSNLNTKSENFPQT